MEEAEMHSCRCQNCDPKYSEQRQSLATAKAANFYQSGLKQEAKALVLKEWSDRYLKGMEAFIEEIVNSATWQKSGKKEGIRQFGHHRLRESWDRKPTSYGWKLKLQDNSLVQYHI